MTVRNSLHINNKIISILAILVISAVGLQALIYVNNLYQPVIYVWLSFAIYLILLLWMYFIFDLHFKGKNDRTLTFVQAIKQRFKHFASWRNFRHFQNYLILPGIIYWSSVVIIGINFGRLKLEHFIAVVSTIALVIAYTFFKEVFKKNFEVIDNKQFLILNYIKLYASWLSYSAALGIVWYYCFAPSFFYISVYLITFMLLYQALFQSSQNTFEHIVFIALISFAVACASYFVYTLWNVNYFSGGLFMTAVYNYLWSLLYHKMQGTLTRENTLQNTAIFALIVIMVFGVTNFNARIDRCV